MLVKSFDIFYGCLRITRPTRQSHAYCALLCMKASADFVCVCVSEYIRPQKGAVSQFCGGGSGGVLFCVSPLPFHTMQWDLSLPMSRSTICGSYWGSWCLSTVHQILTTHISSKVLNFWVQSCFIAPTQFQRSSPYIVACHDEILFAYICMIKVNLPGLEKVDKLWEARITVICQSQ